ncbi:MAG: hypothetical protein ACRDYD_02195 [Acidimicrobiales bacterium]
MVGTAEALVLYLRRNRYRTDLALRLARDPGTPGDVVWELIGSSDPYVRAELCWRGDLPDRLLQRLCDDEDAMVREAAAEVLADRG